MEPVETPDQLSYQVYQIGKNGEQELVACFKDWFVAEEFCLQAEKNLVLYDWKINRKYKKHQYGKNKPQLISA